MLTLKLDLNKLQESAKNRFDSSLIEDILAGLENHQYVIYYTYDSLKEIFHYQALLKDPFSSLPPALNASLSFTDLPSQQNYSGSTLALLIYITKRDQELAKNDMTALDKIYQPVEKETVSILSLTPDEIVKREAERNNLTYFINSLVPENNTPVIYDSNIHLEVNLLSTGSDDSYYLDLRIGTDCFYRINKLDEFLNLIRNHTSKSFGKKLVFNGSLDSFDPTSQKAIEAIIKDRSLYTCYNSAYAAEINSNEALNILRAMKSSTVIYNEQTYHILKEDALINISIDKDGHFIKTPECSNLNLIKGTNSVVLFDNDKKAAQFLTSKNKNALRFYVYLCQNPDINVNYFSDIFVSKLFPLIRNDVTIAPEVEKAIHLSELKISLYVDLDNLSNLVLKSVYTIDNRQITSDFVKNNAALSNQYLAYASALRDFGYESDEVVRDEELINKFLTSDLSFLNNYCTLYLSDSLKNRQTMSYQQFHIQATSDANWLEIQVSNTQYTNEELADILRAYHKKKKFYKFHDTVIYLDDSLEKINEIAKDFSLDNSFKQKVKLPLYQVFKLPGIKENGFDVNYDDALKDIIGDIKDFKQADFVPSTSYLSSMRPYQVAGYKWLNVLKKHSLSGILADDMGLGKTLETISFISDLNDHKPVLIVTPKSLIFNWGKEFQKWNPVIVPTLINGEKNERVKIISTIRNDCKAIYITSYDSLRIDVDSYKDKNFSLVILDEAQYIKNAFALKTKAVKSISSDSRLVLTGTPIENSLADLWSIFDFLMPGYLLSYRDFSKTYTGDISKNPDKVEEKTRLIAKITPFVLRRTKKEVLKDLPPKTIETRYVELNDKQRAVYDATLLKARNELGDDGTSRMNTLAALTRMREICLDPSMFLDNFTELSAKLDITLSIIQEAIASNHKLIVFSSFTRALDHLRKLLNDINIPSQSITGDTKAEERVEIAENFNTRDDYSIILVSLKAGGTGLNLVGGDIVIHLNPWWNLAAEDQATDRAYRIGQKNKVTVIKLVAKNTIEEKVIDLQNSKKDLSDSIIKTGDQGITALSEETIRYLLS